MLVSIIIPARSWDRHLERTLSSVTTQRLPPGVVIEVVVALAQVTTVEAHPSEVVVVPNPEGSIPTGLNRAIAASSGEVVVRVDSRCRVPRDHVARVLERLDDRTIGCIGGAQLVLDRGLFGSTYAIAFNSVLLGPTVYRYRRTSGPVQATYLGAWLRSDLDSLGGFDQRLARNQDNELADRLRASGRVVWHDAALVVGYYNARNLRDTLAHHHDFGLWRMVQRGYGQRALTRRHAAAMIVGGCGAAAIAAGAGSRRWRPYAFCTAGVAYLVAAATATRSAARLRSCRPDIAGPRFHTAAPVLAPALAAALDGAWLVGLVRGACRSRRTTGLGPAEDLLEDDGPLLEHDRPR